MNEKTEPVEFLFLNLYVCIAVVFLDNFGKLL